MGKGSRRRPEDNKKYRRNYDRIFRKKGNIMHGLLQFIGGVLTMGAGCMIMIFGILNVLKGLGVIK